MDLFNLLACGPMFKNDFEGLVFLVVILVVVAASALIEYSGYILLALLAIGGTVAGVTMLARSRQAERRAIRE